MRYTCLVLLVAAFSLSALLAQYQPLHCDSAWYLFAADKLLDGGELYVDIKGVHPPLVFYIHAIPVLLSRLSGCDPGTCFNFFVLALCAGAVALVFGLLDGLLGSARGRLGWLYALVLTAVLLVLPLYSNRSVGHEFGQRDHLILILVVPFIVFQARRLKELSTRRALSLTVQVAFALGILLKPYYIFAWFMLEIYRWCSVRMKARQVFVDNLPILAVFLGYGAAVALSPASFHGLLHALRYYSGYNTPLSIVLRAPELIGWIWLLAAFLLVPRRGEQNPLATVLMLGSFGLLLGALAQHKGWSYHFLPCLGLAALDVAWMVLAWLDSLPSLRIWAIRAIVGSVSAATAVWAGFALVYAVRLQGLESAGRAPWVTPISAVMRTHAARQPVLALSTSIPPFWPAVTYSQARWISPYHHLWLLPGLYRASCRDGRFAYRDYASMSEAERNLLQDLIAAIENERPVLIMLDERNSYLCWKFDFLRYLSLHPRAPALLRDYAELTKQGFVRVLVLRGSADKTGEGGDRR
ncbi:MAG: hypothetical protein JXR96_02555 [Deltaproteobacteria bacterium]|nr:hypothetical protein [Deltaproteobacteria bacterium]